MSNTSSMNIVSCEQKLKTDRVTESNYGSHISATDEGEHESHTDGVAELNWDTDTSSTDGRECKTQTDGVAKLNCDGTDIFAADEGEHEPQTDGVAELKYGTDPSGTGENIMNKYSDQNVKDPICNGSKECVSVGDGFHRRSSHKRIRTTFLGISNKENEAEEYDGVSSQLTGGECGHNGVKGYCHEAMITMISPSHIDCRVDKEACRLHPQQDSISQICKW